VFGIIRPCQHRLPARLRTAWWSHMCGLCLALRDEHGQLARVATNYDGLVISALVEAQAGSSRRTAGPCPLRGMRTASVAVGDGPRLAAAASLVLAAAKVRDHADDGDGALANRPLAGAARLVASRWARQGGSSARGVDFDAGVLLDAVGRQASLEAAVRPGDSVLAVTEPTETATSAACAHTAVLAGRPGNVEPLREVGRLFGRIAHLVDAVEDLAADTEAGAWNPLTATGTSLTEARRLCDDAVLGIRLALRECAFTDGALAHALLVHELEASVIRAFGHAKQRDDMDDYRSCVLWRWPNAEFSPSEGRGFLAGCAAFTWMCCTCQFCCRDPFPGPWSRESRDNFFCNCDGCSCGDCASHGTCCCDCC
jgi:uncharacterized protein DUF5685